MPLFRHKFHFLFYYCRTEPLGKGKVSILSFVPIFFGMKKFLISQLISLMGICINLQGQPITISLKGRLSEGNQADIITANSNTDTINKYLMEHKGKVAKIILPEGSYFIGKPIMVPSNFTLAGAGKKTILKVHKDFSGSQAYILNQHYSLGNYERDSSISLEDFVLDATAHAPNAGRIMGIFLNKVSHTTLRRLELNGIQNEGIYIRSHYSEIEIRDHTIEGCRVNKRGTPSKCIILASATDDGANTSNRPAVVSDFKVLNNELIGGAHGICLFNVKNGQVEGNTCRVQLERGIILSPTVSNITLYKNRVDSAGSTGIHLAYHTKNITIEENTVTNSQKDMSGVGTEGQGIKAYAGFENIKIKNNTCIGNATDGIALEGGGRGENFEIVGNTVKGNNRNGIRLWAGEITIQKGGDISGGRITGNIAEENKMAPLFIGSDNKGKNQVRNTEVSSNNQFKAISGQQKVVVEYKNSSNKIPRFR